MGVLLIYLKGLFMGAADIIPGVSGGTIALITRIYQRLIDAIDHIASSLYPDNLKDYRKNFRETDFALLVPLLLGIATSFLLLSNVIHHLLESQELATYSFFFGLILASAVYLYRQLDGLGWKTILFSVIGLALSFLIVGFSQASLGHSLPVLFGSGAVAITAMILPGISGAFILLLLNQYSYVLGILKDLKIFEMAVFILGAATGLLLFSKLLHYLLREHRNSTMGFLIGLMLGSLRLPAGIMVAEQNGFLVPLAFGVLGFVIMLLLGWLGRK